MSSPQTTAIVSDRAPKPVGPYSQAVAVGQHVFISGQIGLDPATDTMVTGDVAAEAQQAIANLKAILQATGLDLASVVRVDIFLTDLNDFAALNDLYAAAFTAYPLPVRQTVEVSRLPKGARVELSAIAYRPTP
jgi:2-iminobutanoate/2-iminopropanoate deaminase